MYVVSFYNGVSGCEKRITSRNFANAPYIPRMGESLMFDGTDELYKVIDTNTIVYNKDEDCVMEIEVFLVKQ